MIAVFRDARSGLEVIDRDGCLELLAGESIGRVAVIAGAEPVIFPVNYAMHEDRIVFRSAPGSKLTAVVWGAKACFEIDRFDPDTRSGWSVVAVGPADEVVDAPTLRRLAELPLEPWAEGDRDHWMAVTPTRLSGRLLRAR